MPEQSKKLACIMQPQIWTARLSDLREYRQELLTLLNSAEHTRCARYLQQDDRDRYLGGRALTKLATAKLTGLQPADVSIVVAASGKPAIGLARADIKLPAISISHAGELVVVALAHDADIGVDVELLHHDVNLDELMGVVCSAREIAEINKPGQKQNQKSRTQKFYEFWVLKEAYLKATGDGLSADARRLVFSVDNVSTVSLLQSLDKQPAHAWDFFLKLYDQQHVLALASRRIAYEQSDQSRHEPAHCIPVFMDALSLFREYCSGRASG
ncbi:4'-phosphopantetheinyl transferase family protein [Undibacterium pigrum]|uniref:Phosphopantetheinyl transferase n=1 Tax=Undibacterium pigrum TaxID=401470 RepID=A0A318IXN1_9BURK|nr:4'-phosphopantetheinyl transferase superfamily protein [Undibacterium pigrum]PXX40219.1 phosphopantetheinyl transferase [Undibacterium pigrum]